MIKPHMVRVTTPDGTEVHEGDSVKDFRGTVWTFVGVDRLPVDGKSAKVTVRGDVGGLRTFYSTVFDLTVLDLLP